MTKKVDKSLLLVIIILIVFGFIIFNSASLGLLAKGGDRYSSVAFSQTFFGLFLGTIALIATSRLPYKNLKKYSFYLFAFSLVLTIMVFIPKLGIEHGGAKRWLLILGYSFQPSELLKIAFIIYLSAWLSGIKEKIKTFKYGLLPLLVLLGIISFILLSQPDTDVLATLILSGFAIFLAGGGRWRHVLPIIGLVIIGIFIIASMRPYVKQRITTFLNPNENGLTSGYQIQQSLIAIGSGGLTGRGFGQSVQKFNFLPEPIGDSIFAVTGEEFGFLGASTIVILFVFFSIRGLKIAAQASDTFGKLLAVGIVVMITTQAFLNMSAMLGILPLTGNPLPFVSHGGTALFFTLAEVGILLNISRGMKSTA